jgi:hypothetical protein
MPERWQEELVKLRQFALSESVWERAKQGPRRRFEPRKDRGVGIVVALAVVLGGLLVWRAFGQMQPSPSEVANSTPPSAGETKTPIPTGFKALWPERTREAAQEAQRKVESRNLRWRLDPYATAARYAKDVLDWAAADPEPCFLTANCAAPPSPNLARVYVYRSIPCPTDGTAACEVAILRLERLIHTGPTGVWSVTGVERQIDGPGRPGRAGVDEEIVFVLQPEYTVGETVKVKIRNVGTKTYLYEYFYQACFLTYLDDSAREFIIPPGTHCDILSETELAPGETVTLFTWDLDECTRDAWGCQESRALAPGFYTIKGSFEGKDGGDATSAEITFQIKAGSSQVNGA